MAVIVYVVSRPIYNDQCVGYSSLVDKACGLLRQIPPFHFFPNFSALSKHTLDIEYRVYIWQVCCGDNCQIWKWFKESNSYFCKIENFAYGQINEQSFSNPQPRVMGFSYLSMLTLLFGQVVIGYIDYVPCSLMLSNTVCALQKMCSMDK